MENLIGTKNADAKFYRNAIFLVGTRTKI